MSKNSDTDFSATPGEGPKMTRTRRKTGRQQHGRKRLKVSTLVPATSGEDPRELASRPVMLLVLGPHRSGTSVIARLMECLGAENSSNLAPPNFANPKGFFEDQDISQFNDNVLLPRLGLQWHSIGFVDWSRLSKPDRSRLGLQALEIVRRNYPGTRRLSVLKEPRIGVLLPFWLSVLSHAGFDVRIVCCVRDPVSVARSLAARDGFSITHGGMLYATSWLSMLPHIEDLPVALVEFDAVFTQPGKVLRTVAEKLQLPLTSDLEERLHEFSSSHLDPELRHSRMPAEDVALEPDLPPIAAHLHEALLSATRSQNIKRAARVALSSERTIEAFRPVLDDFDQLLAGSRAEHTTAPQPPETPAHGASTDLMAMARERNELAAQLAATQAALEELDAQRTAERTEHEALHASHGELSGRLDSAAATLKQLEENYSALIAERDNLANRHSALVASNHELAASHAALEQSAQEERTRLTGELQELRRQLEQQSGKFRSLQDLADQRLQELAKLGTLVVQKAAALEELETYAGYGGENGFNIKRIEVLDSHETPPHRHLNLILHDVRLPGRHFETLSARLIEHHGRVGLALLRPPSMSAPPFLGWVESGQEGDHSFMLVIPDDTASRDFLLTAGGSDYYFIRFLASAMERALLNRHATSPATSWEANHIRRWLPAARTLLQQLDQLPTRLRSDGVVIKPAAPPGTWSFDFSNVFFGGRSFAHIACEWRPSTSGSRGEILLRLADASPPPLLAWPHRGDHTPVRELTVKFEALPRSTSPSGDAPTFGASDHAFLRSLIAEFPALTEKLAAEQNLSPKEKSHIQKLAQQAATADNLQFST